MNHLFVTGLWRVDVKYNFNSYTAIMPRVIRQLFKEVEKSGDKCRVIVCGNQEEIQHIQLPSEVVLHDIKFKDLPPIPSVSEPCGLKLGWRLPSDGLNKLNRVWVNKIFLMREASRKFGQNEQNIIWLDAALRQFHLNFPVKQLAKFNQIQPGQILTNQYPNPDRVKHCRCSMPHHIKGGVIGCHRSSIDYFFGAFLKHVSQISNDCGSWDEETVLSSLYLENSKLFKDWSDL